MAGLILSTGIGSLASPRLFRYRGVTEKRIAASVAVYVLIFVVAYSATAELVISYPLAIKAILVVVILFPLGFLMGQLFPHGLKNASRADVRLVPWAWAINGTASTVAVGLGFLLSHPLGFNFILYVGAAIYASILLLPLRTRKLIWPQII